jgi:hypothetical protein
VGVALNRSDRCDEPVDIDSIAGSAAEPGYEAVGLERGPADHRTRGRVVIGRGLDQVDAASMASYS